MSDYRHYRRDHPGPITGKSFQFWKKNGGKDLPVLFGRGTILKRLIKRKKKKTTTKNNKNK